MAKKFTELEKKNIREALIKECEESWSKIGYQKTSLDDLCNKAGISKGAFYIFYKSKEDLFCDVLDYIQRDIFDTVDKMMEENPTKEGFLETIKFLFRQYVQNDFLHNVKSKDFKSFLNKLPKERILKHEFTSAESFYQMTRKVNLKFKMSEDEALEIIGTLLSMATTDLKVKEKTIDYVLTCVINEMIE